MQDATEGEESKKEFEISGVDEARAGLETLLQEYAAELNTPKQSEEKDSSQSPKLEYTVPTVRESHNVEVSQMSENTWRLWY